MGSRELTVRLHDGTVLAATDSGEGPALLLPVRTLPYDDATAAAMRQWGADPELGPTLVDGLSREFRVIAADYEGHRMARPATALTPDHLAADLLAIADAAGVDRFAYYGYSWLALAGLQLAVRTPRLWALALGGFPPIDGPYEAMLAVTRAAHRKALEGGAPAAEAAPGDWDAAGVSVGSAVTAQFVSLYEALRGFDERAARRTLAMPRLAFAGDEDDIAYGPGWGDTRVEIAAPLRRHRDLLVREGWEVVLLPGLDHMGAMRGGNALAVLAPWLAANAPRGRA